jgi:hypothetical protein
VFRTFGWSHAQVNGIVIDHHPTDLDGPLDCEWATRLYLITWIVIPQAEGISDTRIDSLVGPTVSDGLLMSCATVESMDNQKYDAQPPMLSPPQLTTAITGPAPADGLPTATRFHPAPPGWTF